MVAVPLCRRWALRVGLVDDPGLRKIHGQAVPLAGGLAVMTGMLVPTLAGVAALWLQGPGLDADSVFRLKHGLERRALELAGFFLGGLGMLVVGVLDDKHELRPGAKFAGQLLIAALV